VKDPLLDFEMFLICNYRRECGDVVGVSAGLSQFNEVLRLRRSATGKSGVQPVAKRFARVVLVLDLNMAAFVSQSA